MSTAIETRRVGDFGAMSPGMVHCLHVTNRISVAAASISMLTRSLSFLLIPNMDNWVISPVCLIVLNKVPCKFLKYGMYLESLCGFTEISVYFRSEPPLNNHGMAKQAVHGKPLISAISFLLHSRHWWSPVPYLSQEKGWMLLLELLSLCFLHFTCLFFPQNKKQVSKQARNPETSCVSLRFLFFSSSKHNWKQHSLQVSVKQAYLLGLAQV